MPTPRMSMLPLLVALGLPGLLHADPPSRVARLSYFSGSVSFRPAALDDWAEASTTYPLTIGDSLWTDDDARGEIRVGRGTVVRLGPYTAFSFLNLDDSTTQMRISEGTLAVTVGRLDPDEIVEVDTPNAAVSLLRPGFYRVTVDRDGYETEVTVRDGEVEVMAGGAAVPVYERETILVSGDYDSARYDIRDARGPDRWEEWCLDRDRRDARYDSRQYVSDYMVGYEDLDEHGRWRDDPEYGPVWVPVGIASNWAPYRNGHWAWVPPWGWTWIDDAPWGFAPFHYGRWARRSWGWCWVPGTLVARPVYAPALVAFVGGDDWFASLSFGGGGGIGWFPLGPHEIYVPPYRVSPGYIRNINARHVTNITQINVTNINVTNITYVNQNVEGAVTAVNRDTFVRGRAVGKAAVVVPKANVQRAKVRAAVVESVKPQKESVVGEATKRAARKPSAKAQDRPVVTRVALPQREERAIADAPPAPRPRALVRPKTEGKPATLKPAREGLTKPRAVRPGERPRPLAPGEGRSERQGTTDAPSPKPTAAPADQERERARETDRQRERSQERPPATPAPPNERQREREPQRATPRPPIATPSADTDRQREREREIDRQRERERSKERPPATPAPADERQREREPRERVTPRPPTSTPTPDSDRDRERSREIDRQRERERPPAKPPSASPSPTERQREREKQKPKKPKAKPTPSPTPTPTPEGTRRSR